MNYTLINDFKTIVVGTGAAGYNTACRLKKNGESVAIVTENIYFGTSRNTGSDKQTYYKLGLGGENDDSVRQMAKDLFSCGSVDGDTALCEAALSARCFLNLCELGVEFPSNRYGEYVGYKTDHDPYARATSAGPLTSKFMTEALQKQAEKLNIKAFDDMLAVEVLKQNGKVAGLACLCQKSGEFTVFKCENVVLATGGPAAVYSDSVYPVCHTGSSSLALLAGAKGQNLTEWQYGLASTNPRWNVSGTYMQVLPRFISLDENGEEREFLLDYFTDRYEALSQVFLKGYQWPFDSAKVLDGSSIVDLLVYNENKIKNRRVFLDFRKNPFGLDDIEYEKLSKEAFDYLNNANACFGTPIERLEKMNLPAIELYKSKGVDLYSEPLEISLCAQHNNGGIAVDLWWQTGVDGLFAVGECAGTHGITRPGGSALNSGQVGSLRASQYISSKKCNNADDGDFEKVVKESLERHIAFCESLLNNGDNVTTLIKNAQRDMSEFGGAIRIKAEMIKLKEKTAELLKNLENTAGVGSKDRLYKAYKLRDILVCQYAYIRAMIDYSEEVNKTRGSALYYDENGELREGLNEIFRFSPGNKICADRIQEYSFAEDKIIWRAVREIPENDDCFENIWYTYRQNKNIY